MRTRGGRRDEDRFRHHLQSGGRVGMEEEWRRAQTGEVVLG